MSSYMKLAYDQLVEAGVAGTEGSLERRVVDGIVALGTFGGATVGALSGRGRPLRQLFEAMDPEPSTISSGSFIRRIALDPRLFLDMLTTAIEEGGGGDSTAPTITSGASVSVAENATLAHALTADEAVTWTLTGGADLARFELSGPTLRWASDGTKNFEAPDDANTDNAYVVQVTATDAAANATNQTVTITVTDVFEIASLFTGADAGVIFDFSDSANLYTDTGKTTLVTAPGDRIALADDLGPSNKDASQATASLRPAWNGKPVTLGAEILSNPDFDTDTVWTKGTGWTIGSGVATKAAGTASVLSQSVTVTPGTLYQVTFNMTRTAGTVTPRLIGGTTVSGGSSNSSRSTTALLLAVTGNVTFEFSADSSFAGTIKRVTLKPVASASHRGAYQDVASERLATGNVDLSASKAATIVLLVERGAQASQHRAIDIGNFTSGAVAGSITCGPDTAWSVKTRDGANQPIVASSGVNFGSQYGERLYQITAFVDRAGAAVADQLKLRARGLVPTTTPTGSAVPDGQLTNGPITLGSANNGTLSMPGRIVRALVINRILSGADLTNAEDWATEDYVRCAAIGDSTVSYNSQATGGSVDVFSVSAFVAGGYFDTADISFPGHEIAEQEPVWAAMGGKSALDAVFVQVGLIDCHIYGASKTVAQITADLQDFVDTIRTDLDAASNTGCKIYICTLTPSKAWIGAVPGTPAQSYALWQGLNDNIAGTGANPITGVDGRITSPTTDLNDGSDNLLAVYDHNADGVHPSNEGKFIIAQAWRAQLVADGLIAGE